jgi:hypothetical protein
VTAYEAQWPYAASRDGRRFGPWAAGEVVDLDPADAEWVNRDSPGALVEQKPAKGERQKPAGADRQHRGGANRGG